MKQLLQFLLAVFIAVAWLSLEEVQCQNISKGTYIASHCYNTSSGKTCFTTFLSNNSVVRKNSGTAKNWCKTNVSGSSLTIISSLEDQRNVEGFMGRQALVNETIFTDARKLSARKRFEWVNGNQRIPKEVNRSGDAACVIHEVGKPLAYCVDNVTSEYHYICEYSDSKRTFSYQQNNKYYVASNSTATWYDARKECFRLEGDLASLTDLRDIRNTSWLRRNDKFWIGLHRNQWKWDSTGAAITYTNWENGFPDDSVDKQCICLSPKCNMSNNATICDERKWWSCNCSSEQAVVCQTEEAKEIADPTKMLSSTSADFKSLNISPVHTAAPSSSSSAITRTTTTATTTSTTTTTKTESTTKTSTKTTAKATTKSTTKPTTKTTTKAITNTTTKPTIKTTTTTVAATTVSSHVTNITTIINTSTPSTTAFAQEMISPAGVLKALTMKEILLMVLLFVAVVFIVVAVILVLRKRKYARRNEESSLKATKQQNEPSAYGTVVPHNGPSAGTVPPSNTIYAEVEMNQRPTPSSNAIYASVQPMGEAVDTGKSVVYADLDFVQNVQKKPKSSDKIAACLSPTNAKPCGAFTSDGNAVYAEPFTPDRPPTVHANIYHQ